MVDKVIKNLPYNKAYVNWMMQMEMAALEAGYRARRKTLISSEEEVNTLVHIDIASAIAQFVTDVLESTSREVSSIDRIPEDFLLSVPLPAEYHPLLIQYINAKLAVRRKSDTLLSALVADTLLKIQSSVADSILIESRRAIAENVLDVLFDKDVQTLRTKYEQIKQVSVPQLIVNNKRYGSAVALSIDTVHMDNQTDLIVASALSDICAPNDVVDAKGQYKKIVTVQSAGAVWLGVLPVIAAFASQTFEETKSSIDALDEQAASLEDYEVSLRESLQKGLQRLQADSSLTSVVFGGLSVDTTGKGGHYEYFELRRQEDNPEKFVLINVNSTRTPSHYGGQSYDYDEAEKAKNEKPNIDRVRAVAQQEGFDVTQVICHHLYTQTTEGCGPAFTETMLQRLVGTEEFPPTSPIEKLPQREATDLSLHFSDAEGEPLNREEVARLRHARLIARHVCSDEQALRLLHIAADDGSSCAISYPDEAFYGSYKLPPSVETLDQYLDEEILDEEILKRPEADRFNPDPSIIPSTENDDAAYAEYLHHHYNQSDDDQSDANQSGANQSGANQSGANQSGVPKAGGSGGLQHQDAKPLAGENAWWYFCAITAVVLAVVAVVAFVLAMIAASAASGGLATVAIAVASTILIKTTPLILGIAGGAVTAVACGASIGITRGLFAPPKAPPEEQGYTDNLLIYS